jgi:hypothetical protein
MKETGLRQDDPLLSEETAETELLAAVALAGCWSMSVWMT